MGDALTAPQMHAGAALLQKFAAPPYGIALNVAPDRHNTEEPEMSQSEAGLLYAVYRHRSFCKQTVACCPIDPQSLVDYAKLHPGLTLAPEADSAAYLKGLLQ